MTFKPDRNNPEHIRISKAMLFSKITLQGSPETGDVPYMDGIPNHRGQKELHFDHPVIQGSRRVVPAGQRGGKSVAAAAEITHGLGFPGSQYWICAPTYKHTGFVFDYVKEWVVNQRCWGDVVERCVDSPDEREIRLNWGGKRSWVRCRSTDPNKGFAGLVGTQLDGVVWDECADQPEKVWTRYLQLRLANRKGWAIFISSPKMFNWFWQYSLREQEAEFAAADWKTIQFSMLDNPYIDPDEVAKMRLAMTDDEYAQEVLGQFRSYAGLVWPQYRDEVFPAGHLYDPVDVSGDGLPHGYDPQDGTNYRTIDIGIDHPTACIWDSVSRKGDIYIYQDYEEQEPTHRDHAESILAKTQHSIQTSFIGRDAKRRSSLERGEDRKASPLSVYRDAGIHCRVTNDDPQSVQMGVSAVGTMLANTLQDKPTGPRLFISKNCVKLRAAIMRYEYKRTTLREDQPTETPTKYDDDLCEAFRRRALVRASWVPPVQRTDLQQYFEQPVKRVGMKGRASVP
ncbi:MAG: terminase large subunit domain-containing protein, partial [Planctomycetota bacterium]